MDFWFSSSKWKYTAYVHRYIKNKRKEPNNHVPSHRRRTLCMCVCARARALNRWKVIDTLTLALVRDIWVMCLHSEFFYFLSIFQSTESPCEEEQRKVQRQRNQALRQIFKVTRWTSLRSQEKNFKGIMCQAQWIMTSPKNVPNGQAHVGQSQTFFLNFLFSVFASCPFTSYTTYFLNLIFALKSRGKAHQIWGSSKI